MVPRFSFPFMHWPSSFFLTLLLSSCSRIDSILYPMQLDHSSNTDSWRGETPLNTQYEVDVTRCCRTAQSELEQRAKPGHHKKSVQFYSCDDVWPSLFLQRDILIDISTGWRPLTSQSRGAKPLPQPPFQRPAITQADIQLLQMLPPKMDQGTTDPSDGDTKEPHASLCESDSDDTSSTSSSSSSSEDEDVNCTSSSMLVINEKSHVVHAVRATHPNSSKRSCFVADNTNFGVNCGSSVLDASIKFVQEIPLGARVCQRKACLIAIDQVLKWHSGTTVPALWFKRASCTYFGYSTHSSPRCFVHLALALSTRCLYTKKWDSPFHLSDSKKDTWFLEKWVSPFDLVVFSTTFVLALSTLCLCTKKWIDPFHF